MTEERFWRLADEVMASSELVIDRPRGSAHPRVPEVIYPLDYGYLSGTAAIDGGGVDVWRGSLPEPRVTGAIMTVDAFKRDAEVKILVGCTEQEAEQALTIHNGQRQGGLLVVRPLQ